ncbi:SDR family NAD(P)-dependent oxidoreductase [Pararhizobium sp. BT-229]|nr:SDR family NAD(P)-dependent oxidoreductase [Pararhizobium sp. BT-229]
MASRAGQRGYTSSAMAYGASKAALINLTKSIALSHGHEGVTSVALAPGWVRTEMAEAFIAEHGEAAALAGIPIARMADPQEIGEIVAFAFHPSPGLFERRCAGRKRRQLHEVMSMRFKEKVVIVTGAAGGIGGAISARFAAEGAQVIVTDMNGEGAEATVSQIVAEGDCARALVSDISTADGCQAIIQNVIATEGRIDVLCNNAGINRRGNLLSLTSDDWNLSFAINVDSMFHLCQAVLPHLIEAGGGVIVNTASQWASIRRRTTLPIM